MMFRPLAVLRHRQLRHELDAFVDGELPVDKHRAVAGHVDECPGCSLVVRQLVKMKNSLRRHRPAIANDDLAKMSAVAEQLTTSG